MTLRELQALHKKRCEDWQGSLDNWSLSDWMVALGGEVGEAMNIVKKLNRIRDNPRWDKKDCIRQNDLYLALEKEFADILAYLFLATERAGFDLEAAHAMKFNEVSEREGLPQRIEYEIE